MAENLSHAEVLGRYVGTFVDELVAAGVENVCLCPGSRSTPLALAFERHPNIKTWIHLDERSCAYFALGIAKASGRPVAILCSSGTAAVNFAPAVVEAFHSHVPLIVLTADRPPELQGLGANQTIDQVNLYGLAVKWFLQLPLPEASDHLLRYVRMVADRAVATALAGPRGPVHINAPFREPLVPSFIESASKSKTIEVAGGQRKPYFAPDYDAAYDIGLAKRPLIVCGEMEFEDDNRSEWIASQVVAIAEEHDIPLLADGLSWFRRPCRSVNVISSFDILLRDQAIAEKLKPDAVLRFGAPPTSKPLQTFLDGLSEVPQVVVSDGGWPDPGNTATKMVHAHPSLFIEAFRYVLNNPPGFLVQIDKGYLASWQKLDAVVWDCLPSLLDGRVSEVSAVVDLGESLPPRSTIVAGNSMPVRDLDTFLQPDQSQAICIANRGASGIDGVISTALGASTVSEGPTVLVIGDLSFYHDMNGLLAAKRFGLRATIVLINNDGGGIFSFLPQHDDTEHFEALWGTPHGLDFSHVAGLYGVGFQRVTTREEYKAALKASFWADGVQVIEIKTDREENLKLHQRIWDAVAEAVKDVALP